MPVILPIVFYTREKGWDVSLDFYDYVDGTDFFRPYTPDFKYLLVELKKYNDIDLKGCLKSFGGALLLDRYSKEKDITEYIHEALILINLEDDKDVWSALMVWVNNFIYNKRKKEEHESLSENIIDNVKNSRRKKEAIEMSMTMAEFLREEGRKDGRKAWERYNAKNL